MPTRVYVNGQLDQEFESFRDAEARYRELFPMYGEAVVLVRNAKMMPMRLVGGLMDHCPAPFAKAVASAIYYNNLSYLDPWLDLKFDPVVQKLPPEHLIALNRAINVLIKNPPLIDKILESE